MKRSGPLTEVPIRMRVVDLARACGSVLGPDRLRSLPRSAAVIDTLLRGRLAPRASPRANPVRGTCGHGRAVQQQRYGLD